MGIEAQIKTVCFALVLLALAVINYSQCCRKTGVLKLCVFSVCSFLMSYVTGSALMLVFDAFSIDGALIAAIIGQALFLMANLLKSRKRIVMPDMELDIKLPLLLCLALGVLLCNTKFGYFGMGQDQGVYQDKAILYMYNITEREYSFPEYDKLETEEEKSDYLTLRSKIAGMDSVSLPENQFWNDFFWGGQYEYQNDSSSFFHGIPTFPAMLALWGRMFGLENMAGVQSLIFMLSVCILWLAMERMQIKQSARTFATLVYTLSPEVIWTAKSTLTEPMLGLIFACFLYMLCNPVEKKRWLSCIMVFMFAIWHVSVFVMIWMFIVLYWFMFIFSSNRSYIRAAILSAVAFVIGFTMMLWLAPRYTLANTSVI